MADHSENSNPKMAPPVDRPDRVYGIYDVFNFGDVASLKQAKNSYSSVVEKMGVAKLHDLDDKKEEVVLPGFRFHPTDEELVSFYLRRKLEKKSHVFELIKESIDLYKYDPWNYLSSNFQENLISLKSSDNEVLKMNKRAATSQSKVLRDVVDSTGGRDEIPVPGVTSLILSKITSFCKKKHKFDTQLNIITELLKCTMDSYKACISSFVKDNQSIFSQLHDAASFLNIPNLMELTSRTMRDMKKGSTTEEISDRYSTLSIARILSPLGLSLRYSS
ncbi:uncharacterized protein LOC130733248 [Lotus japonicus]|uniref:NAC domain-containing protein n=1 Tax=Lotus japonicus TaxID=34305 RepID=I3SSE0_LOTJA|nr:uncharacterized protein LOC130733248 [Lotus japonicus]XP_057441359.1 uncharacterized protein LOC130733248 [Lotus japonicus]XP_057441360.1 uncharacterized protein LOC130733248 [Lotus japonicus]XP_057441361.1 uncharacterized protein LOC130733248 [Lotus japonicus]AFK43182.1 unknown [Lotus japonicus]